MRRRLTKGLTFFLKSIVMTVDQSVSLFSPCQNETKKHKHTSGHEILKELTSML